MKKVLIWGIFALVGIVLAQQNSSVQDCDNLFGDAYMVCIYDQLEETQQQLKASQEQAMQVQRTVSVMQQQIQGLQQDCKPLENSKGQDGWTLVYSNDFENPLYGMQHLNAARQTYRAVDAADVATAEQLNYILGPMHSDTLIFNLCNLSQHKQVRFSFELYLLGSWDSKDLWHLELDDKSLEKSNGLTLDSREDSNGRKPYRLQEVPNPYPYYQSGEFFQGWGFAEGRNKIYTVEYERPHDSTRLTLKMAARFWEPHEKYLNVFNESWAIDNLKVWVLEE